MDFDPTGHNFEVVSVSNYDNLWDVGKVNNWKIVMGNNWFTWFCKCVYFNSFDNDKLMDLMVVPIKRGLGDGCYFPYNDRIYGEILKRAQQQRRTMDMPSYGTQSGTFESGRISNVESTVRMF